MSENAFLIRGQRSLSGTIAASGNKNEVLPVLVASLLTAEPVVIENVPQIRDVTIMCQLLESLGVSVNREGNTVTIEAKEIRTSQLPEDLCREARTSFLFVAPLLHRCGEARLAPPGGDMIGRRRLDSHFYGLKALGADVDVDRFVFTAKKRLCAHELFFDEASVTATEHILMAAVLAEGTTYMHNSASEPHVQNLARFLNCIGAKITGINTNTLVVEGVDKLGGGRHRISSDHIEIGSYLALAAATHGEITITDVNRNDFWMINRVFGRFSIPLEFINDSVVLKGGYTPRVENDSGGVVPRVDDGPWPQFPSDLMSAMIILATQAQGTVLFFEKMFESRMYFVDPLIQMGAKIIVCDPHRIIISGPSALRGLHVRSPDIRAGMALMIAAFCAKGESRVDNAHIVDRGYEMVEKKLMSLGGDIERI